MVEGKKVNVIEPFPADRMRELHAWLSHSLISASNDFPADSVGLHPETVRALLREEPGVPVIGNRITKRHLRRYTSLRIPHSVAERVNRKNNTA